MDESLIAWMMAGGNRFETPADRKDRENARLLREARADARTNMEAVRRLIAPVRDRALGALGRTAATIAAPTTTTDCCGA